MGCQSRALGSGHSGLLVEGSQVQLQMALVTTHHAKKLKHRGTETTEGTRAFHSVVSVPLCFPAFGSAQVAYKKIQGVLRPTESHGMQQCEWNAHLPSPPSPIPSFSHSLLFTFSCFHLLLFSLCVLAPLRLCVFCFLFSVFCFAFCAFAFSVFCDFSRQQISTAVDRWLWPNPSKDRRRPK